MISTPEIDFPRTLSLEGFDASPPLFLAPMAGLTHTALRQLIVELGGFGCLTTEMLSARSLSGEDPESSPYLKRSPEETPLSYQLLASSPEEVSAGVRAVVCAGAALVDINFGCPAPDIRRRGGGSKLMESLERAREIVVAAKKELHTLGVATPLTGKIRLGERLDEEALRDFCLMLEGEGAQLITVHARLRGEPYGRKPRWKWVGKVKEWVTVPVLANGSVTSVEDARECLRVSGADGLMIGRAAVATPWVFNEIAREVYGADIPEVKLDRPALYRRFVELLEESFEEVRRLGRLKEFTHYYATNYPFGHSLSKGVQNAATMGEATACAEEFFRRNEAGFVGWETAEGEGSQ